MNKLTLFNFRNYRHQEVEFSNRRNLILGRNAQGKTNLLESVFLLSYMRSNRARRLGEVVMWGCPEASVQGSFEADGSRVKVKVKLGEGKKEAEVNGQTVTRMQSAKGLVKTVFFSPDDLYLIKGEPSRRRDFFDEVMEGTGPMEVDLLQRYRHVVRQRNALLKNWERHGGGLSRILEPWNMALIELGSRIAVERIQVLKGMSGLVGGLYEEVSGDRKEVSMVYEGAVDPECGTVEEASREMERSVEAAAEEEKRRRTTTVGPHRDEVKVLLEGREARYFASQGEQRTLAFCMRLGQKRFLEMETGKTPILLLDDVMSELDGERRRRVLSIAGGRSQVLMTATEVSTDLGEDAEIIKVHGGEIEVG